MEKEKNTDPLMNIIERFNYLDRDPILEDRIRNKKKKLIVIIDPNPAEDKFYETFFSSSDIIKAGRQNDGVKLASIAIQNGTLSAIVIDDKIEGGFAPMLVSLFRTLEKKTKSDIDIIVTHDGNIDMKKYPVKPDATINKQNGEMDIFY
ncbi:MAG: hypothetical protein N3G74_02370 [Candidatus Micrarchaeota archaeon]|nr:hypothetical protein [Candidatus Micrarchaeota archaeon]